MKRILIGVITLLITATALFIITKPAHADERAQWLYGYVKYSNGQGVGSGKPVEIYFTPSSLPYLVYTRSGEEDSWYKYSFYPPQYFYKVRCRFQVGDTWFSGETIIDDTLTTDAQYDITVYEE